MRAYRSLKASISSGVRLLSVLPEDLPAAIERLQSSARLQQKLQESLQERLAVHEAAALAAKGQKVGAVTLVAEAVAGWDAAGLKRLASGIVARPGLLAVLISSESPAVAVVARSQDVLLDAGDILKALVERFGGKGGGRGPMAQGGGLAASPEVILDAARHLIPTS